MTVPFEKYHGTGNEFLVVEAADSVPDRGALAQRECDRVEGVGADGVLFCSLEDAYSPPRVIMTLVQPDGSTAPMCGNGARCAAEWAMDRAGTDRVMIDTQAGSLVASRDDGPASIAVEMRRPTFDPERVPIEAEGPVLGEPIEGLEVTAVNTGVPHAVSFVEDVDAVELESVALPVRHAGVFPRGTNVTIASADGPDRFRQRTFERGVEGETDSCGTGAVAIAAAARRLGLTGGRDLTIDPPGGRLTVSFDDSGRVMLSGPVEHVRAGELDVDRTTTEP